MVLFNQNLYPMEAYGPQDPLALAGPIRDSIVRDGDGLFIEEGTTNLVTNPSFELGTTGWTVNGAGSIAQSTVRAFAGSKCLRVISGAGASQGAYFTAAGLVSGTTYTWSAYVYVPLGAPDVVLLLGGTAFTTGTLITAANTTKGKWVRLSITKAADASGTGLVYVLFNGTVTAGHQMFVDAAQLEVKSYATTYADGDRATAWNATGALYTRDWEDGSTSSYTFSGGTIANSTTAPYQGTRALRLSATGAGAQVSSPNGLNGIAGVVGGKWYTVSAWVRASAARQLRWAVFWYTAAGASASTVSTTGPQFTGVAGTYVRVTATVQAPADAAIASLNLSSSDSVNTDTFDIDGIRFEAGTGASTYRWTGAEHASSSTRTASVLQLPISPNNTAITIVGLFRVGSSRITGQFPTPIMLGTVTDGFQVYMDGSNGNLAINKQVGGVTTSASAGVSAAVGDLVFFCARYDGVNLKIAASKNGAALVTGTFASATIPAAITSVTIGNGNGTGQPLNGAEEQLLVFNRAVTDAEVTAMAALSQEIGYGDATFTGVIFAAGTDIVRGTTQALTAAGTGYTRAGTAVPAFSETIGTQEGSNPDDDSSATKITVAGGSGIGQGQQVSFAAVGGALLTVQKVAAAAGAYDELYVA